MEMNGSISMKVFLISTLTRNSIKFINENIPGLFLCLFAHMDKDASGFISNQELKKFPTKFIGISLPNDQFHRKGQLEWQKTDLDGDGQISWYEFRRRFINTEDIEPGLIKLFQFANLDVSMIYDPRYEDLLQTFKDSNASTLATIGTMASLPPKSTVELEVLIYNGDILFRKKKFFKKNLQ